MRKTTFFILIIGSILFSTLSCQTRKSKDMPDNSTSQTVSNLKPMYGKGKKNQAQLEADQKFLETCDNTYSSRQEAAKAHIQYGWNYMESGDNKTAMKRFNQAWLLDSLNAEVYWGFGVLTSNDFQYEESFALFTKATEFDPENPILWFWMALNCHDLYIEKREEKYLNLREEYIQKAEKLDPETDYRERLMQSGLPEES